MEVGQIRLGIQIVVLLVMEKNICIWRVVPWRSVQWKQLFL